MLGAVAASTARGSARKVGFSKRALEDGAATAIRLMTTKAFEEGGIRLCRRLGILIDSRTPGDDGMLLFITKHAWQVRKERKEGVLVSATARADAG